MRVRDRPTFVDDSDDEPGVETDVALQQIDDSLGRVFEIVKRRKITQALHRQLL
ncbi:MAG: hypothetical protein ACREM8_03740 [Vulcanimicrobiaceae bacterium]